MECLFCKSEKIVKDGFVKGKQRYLCKNCNKRFRVGFIPNKKSMLKKLAIQLYLEGLSPARVSNLLNKQISDVTIRGIIDEIGEPIKKYRGDKKELVYYNNFNEIIDILFNNAGRMKSGVLIAGIEHSDTSLVFYKSKPKSSSNQIVKR